MSDINEEKMLRGHLGFKGKSAYDIAVELGYSGTIEEWAQHDDVEAEVVVARNGKDNLNDRLNSDKSNIQSQVNALASGSPLVASSTSGMTDKTHIYVNTTDGKWYYWNGSAWTVGGVYQASGIEEGSIINSKIKHGDISIENISMYKDLLYLAKEVKLNKKCSGYNTSTYLPTFSDDTRFNSYIFDITDLNFNSKLFFGFNNTLSYQAYVYYTENVKAFNFSSSNVNNTNNFANYSTEYTRLCICIPISDLYYKTQNNYYNSENIIDDISANIKVKNHNIEDVICGSNIDLKRTDLTKVNGVTLIPNRKISGYNGSKTDITTAEYKNYTVIRIDSRIFTKFKILKHMYIKIDNSTIISDSTNFFVGVQIGVYGYNLKYNVFASSSYYDSTTGLFDLGGYLQSHQNFLTNYQIFGFALNSEELVFYTDEMTDLNTNYDIIKNISEEFVQGVIDDNTITATVNIFNSIGAIGDSYTAGSIAHSDGTTWSDVTNQSYIAILGKRAGVNWANYGVGGSSTRTYQTASGGLQRVLNDTAKDFYMLALGINDTALGTSYLGSISDIKEDYTKNADTFYGNYGKIIAQIKNHAPKAKVVMVKIPLLGSNYPTFNNAIQEIANHFGIPSINPFDDSYFTSSQYNIRPGGHPTILGYVGMGLAYERLLSKCIKSNLNYFQYSTVG